jgi:hypothetical protein
MFGNFKNGVKKMNLEKIEVDNKAYSKFSGKTALILGLVFFLILIFSAFFNQSPFAILGILLSLSIFPIFLLMYERYLLERKSNKNSLEIHAFKDKTATNYAFKLNIWLVLFLILGDFSRLFINNVYGNITHKLWDCLDGSSNRGVFLYSSSYINVILDTCNSLQYQRFILDH